MVPRASAGGQCPRAAAWNDSQAAPSGVAWLMCCSTAGIDGIGSHSPEKNISGKNRMFPMAAATRGFAATAAMNRPRDSVQAAVSSATTTQMPGASGNGTANASLPSTRIAATMTTPAPTVTASWAARTRHAPAAVVCSRRRIRCSR
jgi:hypothetical protein